MPRKVFTPFVGKVTADDLNAWQTIRYDVLGDATTPAGGRAALGAADVNHPHSLAVPSINGIGGSNGYISAGAQERLNRATSFPSSVQTHVPAGSVFMLMQPNGTMTGIGLDTLLTIFGSGGGGVIPSDDPIRHGGEAGEAVTDIRHGGEAGEAVTDIRHGGEAGEAIA